MKFALVGNPNSGKTTLFNQLTGSTAHVGNWPGVTVDRREGKYKKLKEEIDILDLPGIYSLSPYTPEEIIARKYIVEEKPDLIINIVDATNLERNLYLTTQLLEVDVPIIVALNMIDVVTKQGTIIDIKALEKSLGVPVVTISALRSKGIQELMDKAYQASLNRRELKSVLEKSFLGSGFQKVVDILKNEEVEDGLFSSVKLLEGDSLERIDHPLLVEQVELIKKGISLDSALNGDFEAAVALARYNYIEESLKGVLKSKEGQGQKLTDKIDSVLTNKWLGIPIFLFFMFSIFHFTFGENLFFLQGVPSPGVWLQGLAADGVSALGYFVGSGLGNMGAADWAQGLIVDGLIAGVGSILSFLPQILMLFFFLSLMEESGYMARVAFLMDRLLRRFGLSGKAFMPMLMGFGCSVPAIMGTRTIESQRERRMTIFLLPFFSCGAKLPIWALFSAALFPGQADLVIYSIYLLGIIVAIIASIILKKTIIKGDSAPFIMELPDYHLPQLKNLMFHLWDKARGFLSRAATIIAGATIVIWFLSNFNFRLEMVSANGLDSMLGILGNWLRPFFVPLGFASGSEGWKPVVAILTGFIAKEMVVSTMGVLYTPGAGENVLDDSGANGALALIVGATFSPLAGISFMVFNLLSVPCIAAVATANGELRSRKWTLIALAFWLSTAYIVALLIYQGGMLLGLGGS